MDVQLYVYDLSKGLARGMSMQFLGIQIDAVYHTSLVFGGVEYFFGGGVQTCYPGTTHHGRPMEVIPMGRTSLPLDVILEYLESLKDIYTPESYDLFAHNCNNFTNDFSMFLVGKGIPEHITSLPETVLQTPFGQMLKPQIERAMRPVVQAPVPSQAAAGNGVVRNGTVSAASTQPKQPPARQGEVYNVTSQQRLDELLAQAKASCAVVFFTSATCPPCKIVYPIYDELAAEFTTKVTLIKVDISNAHAVAAKYSIRATPTFITFLKGKQEDTWTGASAAQLRGNIRMLVNAAFPPHPHESLKLPTFHRKSRQPVTYAKMPPLEKLVTKMGAHGRSPIVSETVNFVNTRNKNGAQEAPVPNLKQLATFLQQSSSVLPLEILFTAYDLFRLTLVDPRVSGFFAEEQNHATITTLIAHVNNLAASCPYNLRLVTLHVACNLFTTPLLATSAFSDQTLAAAIIALATNNLLEPSSSNLRPAAAALAFNLASAEHQIRIFDTATNSSCLTQALQAELSASLIEALSSNSGDAAEVVQGMTLALARLVYKAPLDGEVVDLCRAMEAGAVVKGRADGASGEDKVLFREIGEVLLGKGLGRA